ncbi:hypothetical protein OOT08_03575 [Leucobacter sp. M11]|nr:hypothetical protein [Leucobacter sp. M11]
MNSMPDRALATDIEAAILATPGVTTIFRTGTTASKLAEAGARLLGIRDAKTPLVAIERTSEQVSVDVSIGVTGPASVVDTVCRLHTVIDALITQETGGPAEIRITVAHIDGDALAE